MLNTISYRFIDSTLKLHGFTIFTDFIDQRHIIL